MKMIEILFTAYITHRQSNAPPAVKTFNLKSKCNSGHFSYLICSNLLAFSMFPRGQ